MPYKQALRVSMGTQVCYALTVCITHSLSSFSSVLQNKLSFFSTSQMRRLRPREVATPAPTHTVRQWQSWAQQTQASLLIPPHGLFFFFFSCTPLALIWVLQGKKMRSVHRAGEGRAEFHREGGWEALSPFSHQPISVPSLHAPLGLTLGLTGSSGWRRG